MRFEDDPEAFLATFEWVAQTLVATGHVGGEGDSSVDGGGKGHLLGLGKRFRP